MWNLLALHQAWGLWGGGSYRNTCSPIVWVGIYFVIVFFFNFIITGIQPAYISV